MTQNAPVAAPLVAAGPSVAPAAEFTPPPPSRTPGLYRRLQAGAALALLLLAVAAALVVSGLRADLAGAPAITEQYDRLGAVKALAIEADTLTARALLGAGTPAGAAAAKAADDRLAEAAGLLVRAAATRTADAPALAEVSATLVSYGQQLRAASAAEGANRTAALTAAAEVLDGRLLPGVDGLQDALRAEATGDYAGTVGWIVPTLAVVVAVALAWISWLVARRSHRAVNLGLAGALVAALAVGGVTLAAQQAAAEAGSRSRTEALSSVAALSDGATAVRTSERLLTRAALLRQWGPAQQAANDAALETAALAVDADPAVPRLKPYRDAGNRVTGLLAKADWAGAGALATETADRSLARTAARFAQIATETSQAHVRVAAEAPASTYDGLLGHLAVAELVALGGAVLAAFGLAQRLKEYR